jgi:hypothetical protein
MAARRQIGSIFHRFRRIGNYLVQTGPVENPCFSMVFRHAGYVYPSLHGPGLTIAHLAEVSTSGLGVTPPVVTVESPTVASESGSPMVLLPGEESRWPF